jgi:hypothetical protein
MVSKANFAHRPLREDRVLFIESTCMTCRESRAFALGAGMDEWEQSHLCRREDETDAGGADAK